MSGGLRYVFKHLKSSDKCKKACNDSTYHQLEIKEALHILWERRILNKQVQHFDVSMLLTTLINKCTFTQFQTLGID